VPGKVQEVPKAGDVTPSLSGKEGDIERAAEVPKGDTQQTPAPDAAPQVSENEQLRKKIEVLTQELNSLSGVVTDGKAATQVEEVKPEPPFKYVNNDEELASILSVDGMNKAFAMAEDRGARRALQFMPQVIAPIADNIIKKVNTIQHFWRVHPDLLAPDRAEYTTAVVTRIEAANPGASDWQILEAAAKYVREKLGTGTPAQQVQPQNVTPLRQQPNVVMTPPTSVARVQAPPKVELVGLEKDLDELDRTFMERGSLR
jgi:hypothetical protein